MIATHSPFVLAIRGAKIYDLDEEPVDVNDGQNWKMYGAYYDFFKSMHQNFRKGQQVYF